MRYTLRRKLKHEKCYLNLVGHIVRCLEIMKMNILECDGEVYYYPNIFTKIEADELLSNLVDEIVWEQRPIVIFGREVMQPRLTAWYGEKKYRYSGKTLEPLSWTQNLLTIKNKIEAIAGVEFNGALLNYYRDGQDSMGWHRDNEKELGENPTIASVSFGAIRRFYFRHYQKKDLKTSIELEHGSLLIMKGQTQTNWEHGLPKKSGLSLKRINITFRVL